MPQPSDELRHLLTLASTGGVIGLLVGFARYVITAEHGSVRVWVRGIVAGTLVGVLVAWGLDSITWATTLKGLVIGLSAYIAGDLLHGLMLIGTQIRADPLGFFRSLWASLRGGHRT